MREQARQLAAPVQVRLQRLESPESEEEEEEAEEERPMGEEMPGEEGGEIHPGGPGEEEPLPLAERLAERQRAQLKKNVKTAAEKKELTRLRMEKARAGKFANRPPSPSVSFQRPPSPPRPPSPQPSTSFQRAPSPQPRSPIEIRSRSPVRIPPRGSPPQQIYFRSPVRERPPTPPQTRSLTMPVSERTRSQGPAETTIHLRKPKKKRSLIQRQLAAEEGGARAEGGGKRKSSSRPSTVQGIQSFEEPLPEEGTEKLSRLGVKQLRQLFEPIMEALQEEEGPRQEQMEEEGLPEGDEEMAEETPANEEMGTDDSEGEFGSSTFA